MDLFNYDNISEVGTQTTETKDGHQKDMNNNDNTNQKNLSFSDMSSIDHEEDETLIEIQDISESPSKRKRKLTKEDLETIPLPLFECMYCSNELITFEHLSKQVLSKKYLLLTSIFDMQEIASLMKQSPMSIKSEDFVFYSFDYEFQSRISLMLMNYIKSRANTTR